MNHKSSVPSRPKHVKNHISHATKHSPSLCVQAQNTSISSHGSMMVSSSDSRLLGLSPLSKFCKRETFASESLNPEGRLKNDNGRIEWPKQRPPLQNQPSPYNLYPAVRLLVISRAPEGFLSSRNGYTRRLDVVL